MDITMNVTFGDKKSYTDWGLILTEYPSIEPPEPRTYTLEVPGGNGSVDLTEAFGGVTYEDRGLEFKFKTIKARDQIPSLLQEIQNTLHGKRMHIVLDSDPDYYYDARVTVDGYELEGNNEATALYVDISAMAHPFKRGADSVQQFTAVLQQEQVECVGVIGDPVRGVCSVMFGTPQIPTHDFSVYESLVFSDGLPGPSSVYAVNVLHGSSGNLFFLDESQSITKNELTEAGIDPSKIYGFDIHTTSPTPKIYGVLGIGARISVSGSIMPSVPVFSFPDLPGITEYPGGLSMIWSGKKYSIPAENYGEFYNTDIVLGYGTHDIAFLWGGGGITEFTVVAKIPVGWL